MLVSDVKKFAFVHFYRTGGTWLCATLMKHAPSSWKLHQDGHEHMTAERASDGYKLFAFVRNPWDWYVSNYFFYRQHWEDHTGGYLLPRQRWILPEEEFAQMFELCKKGDGFAQGISKVIQGEYVHSQMTRTFNRLVKSSKNELRVGRFENLRDDSKSILEWASGEPLPQPLAVALSKSKPKNSSRHKPYHQYYSPRLRSLVARHDKELIDEFGYKF